MSADKYLDDLQRILEWYHNAPGATPCVDAWLREFEDLPAPTRKALSWKGHIWSDHRGCMADMGNNIYKACVVLMAPTWAEDCGWSEEKLGDAFEALLARVWV